MATHRRGRYGPSPRTTLVAGVAVGVVLGGALIAAAAIPLAKGAPSLSLSIARAAPRDPTLHLPFPSQGESAVSIPLFGRTFTSGKTTPVPIASLAKLMNAYVTLHALPLAAGEDGPSLVVEPSDVAEYREDLRTGQSCVAVAAGEVLTERELLDGLLVHSANNFATLLGRLVAGDDTQMIADMNETAAELGMRSTTYADVSGFDPATVSTAADQLHLATLLLEIPTFAAIVRQTSVTLPVAGTVTTYTPYLGKPHVVGVKSGDTAEAGGCDVMAYDAYLDGHTVLVIAVVLGQRPAVAGRSFVSVAGRAALVLASGTAERLSVWHVAEVDHAVGSIGWPSRAVPVVASTSVAVVTFDGIPAVAAVTDEPWGSDALADREQVATLFVTSGPVHVVAGLVTAGSLTRPSLWQRLR